MRSLFSTLFLLLFTLTVSSQNLVPNPGFEGNTGFPSNLGQWALVNNWNNVNLGPPSWPFASPDYFHTNGTGGYALPVNTFGTVNANNGDAVMGFIPWIGGTPDFREYLSCQLTQQLQPGNEYEVSFYITNGLSSYGGYGCDNLGVNLSGAPLTQVDHEPLTTINPQFEMTSIFYDANWVQVSFPIVPTTWLEYLTIGNFKDDANTNTAQLGPGGINCYYYVDDFSVVLTRRNNYAVGDTTICLGGTATLNAITDSTIWWSTVSLPNDTVSTDTVFNISPATTTSYIFNGPFQNDTITVTVVDPPAVNLGNDTLLCSGQSILMDATYPGATYLWHDNDTNATFTADTVGIYHVTVTNMCGSVSDSLVVTTILPPVIDLGNDTTLCPGESTTLDGSSPSSTYLWQDNSTNPTLFVNTAGTYYVTTTNACGSDMDTVIVQTAILPVFDLGNDTSFCQGDSVILDATYISSNYLWHDNSNLPTFVADTTGLYSVAVTNSCGTVEDSLQITIIPLPQIDMGPDTALCPGHNFVLDATYPGATYLWHDNSTGNTFNVGGSGTYWVTVTDGCGSFTDSMIVYVATLPVVQIGNDTTICAGDTLYIDVTTFSSNYLWQDGSGFSFFNATTSGVYWVTVTTSCGSDTDSLTLHIMNPPQVNLGNDTIICTDETLALDATDSIANYLWQDGSTLPTYTVSSAGQYIVTLDNICGVATDTIDVQFDDCEPVYTLPNVFSPNEDGINDVFGPTVAQNIETMNLTIYNRWGEIMMIIDRPGMVWDGRTSVGVEASAGVYYWILQYAGDEGVITEERGFVTLVR